MRRLALAVLLSGVAVLPLVGCGSSGSSNPDGKAGSSGAGKDGGAGKGGNGGAGTGSAGTGSAGTAAAGNDGGAGTTGAAGHDGGTPDGDAGGDASDAPVLTAEQQRGSYLVNSVLGCTGCHATPKTDTQPAKVLGGNDCFAKDTGGGCLASANLTNDATGIKDLSDQQVIDAFTKGIYPVKLDGGTQYLFSNMPYYQFANLTMADATAIVAYLRTVTPVNHAVAANTGTFATRPTAAQWASVAIADLPSPVTPDGGAGDAGTDAGDAGAEAGAGDAGTPPSTANGKYMATLMCSVCHTVNTAATAPLQLDATKAFQGGKKFNTTLTVPADGGVDGGDAGVDGGDAGATMMITKEIQSANLTPDTTGLKTWTAAQIVTAIKQGKDEGGRSICSPMRPFPNLTDKDALDIAAYLQAIPPVANAITETCE
jgi:hypothetical protein